VSPSVIGARPPMACISTHGGIELYPIIFKLFCPTITNLAYETIWQS
jgi:hypothetical protein